MKAKIIYKKNKSVIRIEVLDNELPKELLEEFIKGIIGENDVETTISD